MLAIIIGNLGSGKTLFMIFINLLTNREVWSNIKINISNYKKLEVPDLFNLKDYINVLMDEGYAWIESRVSSSSLNEYISSIIFHTRKTFTNIYLTTPMFSTIDKRFRKQANYIIECQHRNNFNSDDFRFTINNINNNTFSTKTLKYNNAKKYFKYYNTYEKTESHRKRGLEFKILKQYPNKLKERILELTELIKNEMNGKKITHDSLKDCLLMNEIDLDYERHIYIRLKGIKRNDNS